MENKAKEVAENKKCQFCTGGKYCPHKKDLKEKVIDLINSYWRFDSFQEPRSTWHEKQEFLKEIQSL